MRCLLFLVFMSLSAKAQFYQTIKLDSALTVSESDDKYRMIRGMGGYVCKLDQDGELSYILVDDIIPHREYKHAGQWTLKGDTVEFVIDDRRGLPLSIFSSNVPFTITYKTLSFRWKMPTSLINHAGKPVVFETVVKVLIEAKDIYTRMIFAEFQQYFRTNYKPESDSAMDEWGFMVEAGKVNEMISNFFNERKVLSCVKHYQDGILQEIPR